MRDWMNDLRRASYRGAHFWVEKDEYETGRRLVVHEFPLRDVPYVEDLGRKANTVTVTAYVVSDNADGEAASLRSACDKGGAGKLELPLEGFAAHCQSFRRTHDKDRLGFIAFQITFVREGGGAAPISLAFASRLVAAAAGGIASALSAFFNANYSGLGVTGFVRDSAVSRMALAAAAIDASRATMRLKPDLAPPLARLVEDLYADAGDLSEGGRRGDSYEPTAYRSENEEAASAFAERVLDVMEALRTAAASETESAAALAVLSEPSGEAFPPPRTPSAVTEQANAALIEQVLRIAALIQWAVALSETEFTDPREARQARADVSDRFGAELAAIVHGKGTAALITILEETRGALVRYLSGTVADLAPVVTAEANEEMPALWWANALYGDGTRAGEISTRNGVIHPMFMPREFSALAR